MQLILLRIFSLRYQIYAVYRLVNNFMKFHEVTGVLRHANFCMSLTSLFSLISICSEVLIVVLRSILGTCPVCFLLNENGMIF